MGREGKKEGNAKTKKLGQWEGKEGKTYLLQFLFNFAGAYDKRTTHCVLHHNEVGIYVAHV